MRHPPLLKMFEKAGLFTVNYLQLIHLYISQYHLFVYNNILKNLWVFVHYLHLYYIEMLFF